MTVTTYQTVTIPAEQLGSHVMLVEWLIKQQQQLSVQQRLLARQQQLIDQKDQQISAQQQQISAQQQEIEKLKEERDKLKNRDSKNSSVPPSSDQLKKPSDKKKRKKGKKRGPKYNHPGKTRNGFGQPDKIVLLELENCPVCGGSVERDEVAAKKVQQVAEVVEQPIEIREYRRPFYKCPICGWSGYSPLPLGVLEGFSYGARLSSIVGWLGYGGNLTWRKQEHFVEYVFGIPISQGSLSKMHKWFQESLEPLTSEWLKYIQQPGVRCVDETTYCIDGIKYWVWVATSNEVCVLMLAPTRSSAEVEKLLGTDFEGILTSDCYGAYFRQSASAKQKCLAHLERELESLKTSRFQANRQFAADVQQVLKTARIYHRHYHTSILNAEELGSKRIEVENLLQEIFQATPKTGWPYDAQRLINRLKRHWDEWFTFLTHPQVKPDNNDAERALRPIVVHRKVSGGARSDWGAELVAQMFSFLETMRLQGNNAIASLCELLSLAGRSPPGLEIS